MKPTEAVNQAITKGKIGTRKLQNRGLLHSHELSQISDYHDRIWVLFELANQGRGDIFYLIHCPCSDYPMDTSQKPYLERLDWECDECGQRRKDIRFEPVLSCLVPRDLNV